ncbi:MAG: glycosyltransferase family 39 protein, partial [Gemmatimonadales bacterium]
MTEPAEPQYSLKVWHLAVAMALVVVHLVFAWLTRVPSITVGNDDALYLLLSQSVQSFQYLNAHIVGAPPHGQYPPGYPAFLAVWTGLFGGSLDTVLVAGMLMSATALVFVFDLARRLYGGGLALAVLAALAVNPALVHYAGRVASEPPFMLLLVLGFWVAMVLPEGRRRLFALGILAILAAMTRSVGICLVLALGLVWLLERRWKAVAVFGIAVALTVGTWLLWTSVAPGRIVPRSYAATVVKTANRASGQWLGALWDRGVTAVDVYGAHSVPSSLSVPTISGTSLDNLFWSAVIVLTLAASVIAFRKRLRLLP